MTPLVRLNSAATSKSCRNESKRSVSEHTVPIWVFFGKQKKNRVTDRRKVGVVVAFCFQGSGESTRILLTLRSILANPRAFDARSLASWNSSLSDRLVSITDRLMILNIDRFNGVAKSKKS